MTTAIKPSDEYSYQKLGSVFTVFRNGDVHAGRENRQPDDQSVDIAVVQFNDDGTFVDGRQLQSALTAITEARKDNPNGAIVMVFVHGWHHSVRWDDTHFVGFRNSLVGLAIREAERYGASGPLGRRVIGIWLGWHGDNPDSILGWINDNLTFWNRYAAARHIGEADALKVTLREVTRAAKGPLDPTHPERPPNDSALIMMGHSMGALMFEIAFLSLLRDPTSGLLQNCPASPMSVTRVESGGVAVTFPDLLFFLNSAADSNIATAIIQELTARRIRKQVIHPEYSYEAPLLISLTSETDWATKYGFRVGKFWRKTDGHDSSLVTHELTREARGAVCTPKPSKHLAIDFEQAWHCLRSPRVDNGSLASIAIDLPQNRNPRDDCHVRNVMQPARTRKVEGPFWLFKVPSDIADGHNGIYDNARLNLLMMGLMQASGTIMSLAERWIEVFEPDEGRCSWAE